MSAHSTSKFGKEFEKNIVAVGQAASQLGSSIEIVNRNVENQQMLLQELRSDGMIMALDRFIDAGKQFKESTKTVKDLDIIRTELSSTVSELIKAQKDYNSSLVVPKLIAERLNNILERVSTFEDSVNVLGESIAQTQMLGNSEMTLIKEHLDNIKRKDAIATEYQETANDELKSLFDTELNTIKVLQEKYTSAVDEYGEGFRELMNKITDAIKAKKEELMQTLQDAFDIAELNTEFAHLNRLPEIKEQIKALNVSVDNFNESVMKQSAAEIGKLDTMDAKLDTIPSVVKEQCEDCQDKTYSAIAATHDVEKVMKEAKTELQNQINTMLGKLSMIEIDVDSLRENAKLKVSLNKEEMLDVAKAIREQREEVVLLDNMLGNTKKELSDMFTKVFEYKLEDIRKKIDTVDALVDSLKAKAKK